MDTAPLISPIVEGLATSDMGEWGHGILKISKGTRQSFA